MKIGLHFAKAKRGYHVLGYKGRERRRTPTSKAREVHPITFNR